MNRPNRSFLETFKFIQSVPCFQRGTREHFFSDGFRQQIYHKRDKYNLCEHNFWPYLTYLWLAKRLQKLLNNSLELMSSFLFLALQYFRLWTHGKIIGPAFACVPTIIFCFSVHCTTTFVAYIIKALSRLFFRYVKRHPECVLLKGFKYLVLCCCFFSQI